MVTIIYENCLLGELHKKINNYKLMRYINSTIKVFV